MTAWTWTYESPRDDVETAAARGWTWDRIVAHFGYSETFVLGCMDRMDILAGAADKPMRTNSRPPSPCGTNAAYRRHQSRGERVDEACAKARSDYNAERYARAKKLRAERIAA